MRGRGCGRRARTGWNSSPFLHFVAFAAKKRSSFLGRVLRVNPRTESPLCALPPSSPFSNEHRRINPQLLTSHKRLHTEHLFGQLLGLS